MNFLRYFRHYGNKIASTARIGSNVKIGKGNFIGDNVTIHDNTIIGDNNVFLSGNQLGVLPIVASKKMTEIKCKGLIIGNNNQFHVDNMICSGYEKESIIGDNNKFMAEIHGGHDLNVGNNVHIYPRAKLGGHTTYMDNSGIGMSCNVLQRIVIGQYAFTGMNTNITRHAIPFYINIGNKIVRINSKRIADDGIIDLNKLESVIKNLDNPSDLLQLKDVNNEIQVIIDKYNFLVNSQKNPSFA